MSRPLLILSPSGRGMFVWQQICCGQEMKLEEDTVEHWLDGAPIASLSWVCHEPLCGNVIPVREESEDARTDT